LDVSPKKLSLDRKNSFWLFLRKKTHFLGKKVLTAEVEKKLVFLRQKVERFQRKRLTSDFPYLFTYGTFFSIKWVFVLIVKQRLRAFL